MGRQKPNKPKRERAVFGSQEMDLCVAEAVQMALRTNTIAAATRAHGPLKGLLMVRNFDTFEGVLEAMAYLDTLDVDIFLVLPDVIELECRLANLPNIDKGTPMYDIESRRTARVYRYANKEQS
ncbi:hypothetical protein [Streptomyces europaeiscabiei]|uniref:hypothetical protein n=1 Tax=Streptomyces europaeiscabiei TaxID=146819 RepID=UPI002E185D1A